MLLYKPNSRNFASTAVLLSMLGTVLPSAELSSLVPNQGQPPNYVNGTPPNPFQNTHPNYRGNLNVARGVVVGRDNSPISFRHPARQQLLDPTLSPPCRKATSWLATCRQADLVCGVRPRRREKMMLPRSEWEDVAGENQERVKRKLHPVCVADTNN